MIVSVKKHDCMIHENLFIYINQYSTISFTWENSKMFNITSKYFRLFKNKPLASWVAHLTRDFHTCYSCSYYSSMDLWRIDGILFLILWNFFVTSTLYCTLNILWLKKKFDFLSLSLFLIVSDLLKKADIWSDVPIFSS